MTESLTIDLDEELAEDIKQYCETCHMPINHVVYSCLKNFVTEYKRVTT